MFMLKPVHLICYSQWNAIHEESGIEFQSHCVLQNQLIFCKKGKDIMKLRKKKNKKKIKK